MNTDPYAPPRSVGAEQQSGSNPSLPDDVKRRLRFPATAIVILASLNLLLDLSGVTWVTLINEFGELTLLLFLHGFQAVVGVCMRTLTCYPLATIGVVTVCIPCLSPLVVVGIPFGIWALVLLSRDETKVAFDLAKEPLSEPPQ